MSDAPSTHAVGCLAIEIQVDADGPDPRRRRLPVITPLGERGELRTQDGRIYQYPAGATALAAALNAQPMAVRVDIDHTTEPTSHTYRGSTAAEGWISEFAATPAGGIDALADLGHYAAFAIAERLYRYVSPVLIHDADGLIHGLSSVALTNRPALGAAAHLHRSDTMPPTDSTDQSASLDARERDLTARERALATREAADEQRATTALDSALDAAVAAGRIEDGAKEQFAALARGHADGIHAGIDAALALLATIHPHTPTPGDDRGGARDTTPVVERRSESRLAAEATLTRRLVPSGPPPGAGTGTGAPNDPRANRRVSMQARALADLAMRRGQPMTIPEAVDAVTAGTHPYLLEIRP